MRNSPQPWTTHVQNPPKYETLRGVQHDACVVMPVEDPTSKSRHEGPVVFLVNEVLGRYTAAATAYIVWTVAAFILLPLVLPASLLGSLGFLGILGILLVGMPLAGLVHVLVAPPAS